MIVVILKLDGKEPHFRKFCNIQCTMCEQFSAQNTIKCDVRSALNTSTVVTPIRLSGEGLSIEKFDPSDSIDHWFSTDKKMGDYTHWPSDCSDNDDDS